MVFRNITVEPVIFFYFLAIYLLFSVFHPTVFNRVCISYLSQSNITNLTPDSCTLLFTLNTTESAAAIQHINQETNSWIKWTTLASYLPSIVTDCFIGGWGDLFGRKLPMFLPSVGGVLASIVYICFVMIESLDVSWLLVASVCSGMFGGVTSVIANCFSYVASLIDKENRTFRVSIVDGMLFVAATIGPFSSKFLKDSLGTVYVFSGYMICHVLVIVYCIFLKEPAKSKSNITCSKLFNIKHLLDSIRTVFVSRPNKANIILLLQLVALFISINIVVGEADITYIFLANIQATHVFEYYLCLRNAFSALALLALLPLLKYFQLSDTMIGVLGVTSWIVGSVVLAFTSSVPMLFIAGVTLMGSRMTDAILRSLASQNVEDDEIGKIFGFIALMGDISLITGSQMYNSMFTPLLNSTGIAGMTFLVGAAALVIPFILILATLVIKKYFTNNDISGQHIYSNNAFE